MAYQTSRESVAYDYEQIDARFARTEREEQPAARQKTQLKAVPTVQPRVLFRAKNLMTAIVVLLVAGLMVHSYMMVTELTTEIASQRSALSELESINTALVTKQEYNMSSEAIETYATEQLGMIKLDNSQIEYVEMSNPDKVEVSNASKGIANVFDSLIQSFSAVLEYLH